MHQIIAFMFSSILFDDKEWWFLFGLCAWYELSCNLEQFTFTIFEIRHWHDDDVIIDKMAICIEWCKMSDLYPFSKNICWDPIVSGPHVYKNSILCLQPRYEKLLIVFKFTHFVDTLILDWLSTIIWSILWYNLNFFNRFLEGVS